VRPCRAVAAGTGCRIARRCAPRRWSSRRPGRPGGDPGTPETQHPGSSERRAADLPVTVLIEEWEGITAAGAVVQSEICGDGTGADAVAPLDGRAADTVLDHPVPSAGPHRLLEVGLAVSGPHQ